MSDSLPMFWSNRTNFEGLMQRTDERILKASEFPRPAPISTNEWDNARMGPSTIVEGWFYEDVGVLIAPGGTGKTTLVLFMAIHIALGRDLFGATVVKPGPVVILTAEDARESLVARLRSISQQMLLSAEEVFIVQKSILISDVSGNPLKLTEVSNQVVKSSNGTERLIRAIVSIQPVVVFIDPAVSFGIGEHRVNDAEQGLIEAARKIRNEASCCVEYVHHTGKQAARTQSKDQYSGRGGSAFADGSRMVHVLQPMEQGDWLKATGDILRDGEVGLVLARPKISHAPPQPEIYLKRTGHIFAHYRATIDKNSALTANAERVLEVIEREIAAGRMPTGRSLEAMQIGLKQKELRDAIAWLRASNRITEVRNQNSKGRGGVRSYLKLLDSTDGG